MSADNGIYILKTKDGQYRVADFQAVDNLYYNCLDSSKRDELCPLEVILQYEYTKFTRKYEQALVVAGHILEALPVCEYGIQLITSDKTWDELCNEAKKMAIRITISGIGKASYNYRDLNRIAFGSIGERYD